MTTEKSNLKPCPFCGKDVQAVIDSNDVLHHSGIVWQETPDSGRTYHRRNESLPSTTAKGECWDVNCPTHLGGCGASISGDSEREAIEAWNKRAHAEVVLPEPAGVMGDDVEKDVWSGDVEWFTGVYPPAKTKLYTERQVREILAQQKGQA